MKKLFILMLLMNFATLSFAQTKATNKTTPKKPKIEDVLNQQVDILNARIDSMTIAHQQAIELVKNEQKEHYANYYNQLDSDFDRWLVYMSIFWTIIGVILGIVIPSKINKNFEDNIKRDIEKFKSDISSTISAIDAKTDQKMKFIERVTINRVRMRYNDIDQQLKKLNDETSSLSKMKGQLEDIRVKIEISEKNAKASEDKSKINRLFAEALNESDSNPSHSIELYTEIISINNQELRAYNNRAVAFFENGEFAKAIEDTTKILNIDNSYASAYAIRALANAKLNNRKEALSDFENCIKYGTEDQIVMAYESRSTEFMNFEMWTEAIKDYDAIANNRPLNAFELNNRAFAYYKLGKHDIALLDIEDSIKIDNKNAAAYDTLGCIYVAKEMYFEALKCFDKAIELKPDLWETYENRVNLYNRLIDIAETAEEKAKYKDLYEQDIEIVRKKKVKKDDEDEE